MTVLREGAKPLPVVPGARKPRRNAAGGQSAERARAMIQTGKLVARLQKIADGEVESAPHQVTAALGLLRKVLPDLQATLLSIDPQSQLTIIMRDE